MWDVAQSLLKIHYYNVALISSTYMICVIQLGLARQSSPKTVLAMVEYIVQDFIRGILVSDIGL